MKTKLILFLISLLTIQSCATTKEQNDAKENEKTWGIDISHYQKITDWNQISEQEPGFVFVKATEGSTIKDPKYIEYYNAVREHNIFVGSYHFFTYRTTGKEQANNFLATAIYQRGDLPLVLDAEYAKQMPGKEQVRKELLDFIYAVYSKTESYPIVYCAYRYYLQYLKDCLPEGCKLWIVDYKEQPNCPWSFWQTTEKYKVKGIKGFVDFNMFNGTKKDLKKMLL